MGQGSGFLIREDGYIITNNHVVSKADRIKVRTVNRTEYTAKVVGSDPKTEVAVVKIEGDHTFPFLNFGRLRQLRVGEWVWPSAIPWPLPHRHRRHRKRQRTQRSGHHGIQRFHPDGCGNQSGNSGGPLLNVHGDVVGLNTAIFSRSGGNVGVGFAVPINVVKFISDQLVDARSSAASSACRYKM